MTVRVGINGFGRVGRSFVRAVQDQGADMEVVAANDLGSVDQMAHLLRYDSVFGRIDNLFDKRWENPIGFLVPGFGAYGGIKVAIGG